MNMIRTNPETGLFEIVSLADDGETVLGVIRVFPEGTTNAEACAAYDEWRKTLVAKDGNLEP